MADVYNIFDDFPFLNSYDSEGLIDDDLMFEIPVSKFDFNVLLSEFNFHQNGDRHDPINSDYSLHSITESECNDINIYEVENYEEDNNLISQKVNNLKKIIKTIESITEMAKYEISEKYSQICSIKNKPRSTFSKHQNKDARHDFWFKFNPPYFKDCDNFPAWLNDDAKFRFKHGLKPYCELLKEGRIKWDSSDINDLQKFVKKQFIDNETARLEREKHYFKKSLKNKELQRKIHEINMEIEMLNSKNYAGIICSRKEWKFDWDKISIINFNCKHSSKECEQFWNLFLKPQICKEPWSKFEESRLVDLVYMYNYQNWEKICAELGTNRSPFQAICHFQAKLINHIRDYDQLFIYTPTENGTLKTSLDLNLIDKKYGAHFLLMAKSCHQLGKSSFLKKGRFTMQEDKQILSIVEKHGFDNFILTNQLKCRSIQQIRSRYERLAPEAMVVGRWTTDEDNLLMNLIDKYGIGSWSKIAARFVTRNRTQIRQRYSILRNSTDNQGFSDQKYMKDKTNLLKVKSKNVEGNSDRLLLFREMYDQQIHRNSIIEGMKSKISEKLCNNSQNIEEEIETNKPSLNKEKICDLVNEILVKGSTERLLNKELMYLFQENIYFCKHIPKCSSKMISELGIQLLHTLIYLNSDGLNNLKIADIEENDELCDTLKSVIIEVMNKSVRNMPSKNRNIVQLSDSEILYNLPVNVSTVIFFRSVELSKRKLKQWISVENDSSLSHNDIKPSDSTVTGGQNSAVVNCKAKIPKCVDNLPATKLFQRRFIKIIKCTYHTIRHSIEKKQIQKLKRVKITKKKQKCKKILQL